MNLRGSAFRQDAPSGKLVLQVVRNELKVHLKDVLVLEVKDERRWLPALQGFRCAVLALQSIGIFPN